MVVCQFIYCQYAWSDHLPNDNNMWFLLQVKSLKSKHVTSVGVGHYHTAMCTSTEVYTVGRNLGQLGFDKHHDTTLGIPRLVSGCVLDQVCVTPWSGLNVYTCTYACVSQSNVINLQYVCIEMSINNLGLRGSVGPSRTETATVIEVFFSVGSCINGKRIPSDTNLRWRASNVTQPCNN